MSQVDETYVRSLSTLFKKFTLPHVHLHKNDYEGIKRHPKTSKMKDKIDLFGD